MFDSVCYNKAELASVILELDEAADALEKLGFPYDHPLSVAKRKINKAGRILRDRTEDTEALIRDCAKRGMSKQQTYESLRISRYRFRLLIEAMPDVKWIDPAQSEGRKRYNESLIGTPLDDKRREILAAAAKERLERMKKYEVRGIRGSAHDLWKYFKEQRDEQGNRLVQVGYSQVTNRMRLDGMDIEQALFEPRRLSAIDNTKASREHRQKLKDKHHDQIMSGARREALTRSPVGARP